MGCGRKGSTYHLSELLFLLPRLDYCAQVGAISAKGFYEGQVIQVALAANLYESCGGLNADFFTCIAIVSAFVSAQWPIWSGKKRPEVLIYGQKPAPAPADSKKPATKQPEQKQSLLGKLLGSKDNKEIETVMDGPFKKPVASPPQKGSGASSRDAELAQLSDMGFTIEVSSFFLC